MTQPKAVLELAEMSNDLKNSIWNLFVSLYDPVWSKNSNVVCGGADFTSTNASRRTVRFAAAVYMGTNRGAERKVAQEFLQASTP